MIEYHRALAALTSLCRPMSAEQVPLARAAGRVLHGDVRSKLDLPPFDNAAMDGFALPANGAVVPAGSEFNVQASQAAGDGGQWASPQLAWEIMTGAQLPEGLDAVIPVERCEVLARDDEGQASRIRLLDTVRTGMNVREHGGDVRAGETVLRSGRLLDAAAVSMLAALGHARVPVARTPRVAIICTGKELVAQPGASLPAGHIHNSNGPYLAAAMAPFGAEIVLSATVGDTGDTYRAALADAMARGADLVVSTGAVSAGRYDFVPGALAELGATTLFHKIPMRPGKPILGAHFPHGPIVLALPGNPLAVAVGMRFFVTPVLRAWRGQAPERAIRVRLDAVVNTRPGLRHIVLGHVRHNADGQLRAQAGEDQQSHRLATSLAANAWLVLDEKATGRVGDDVEAWPLDAHGAWYLG
jgi:molybdopterin molybdotransferase